MTLKNDFEKVKAHISMEDYLSGLNLEWKGNMFKCPLHEDSDASAHIWNGLFKCFGAACSDNPAMDVIELHKRLNGFRGPYDALRDLADKYHITLSPRRKLTPKEQKQMEEERTLRQQLDALNGDVVDFMVVQLDELPEEVIDAKRRRDGHTMETMKTLKVGYIPPGKKLIGYLRKKGHDDDIIIKGGYAYQDKRGDLREVVNGGRFTYTIRPDRPQYISGRKIDAWTGMPEKYLTRPKWDGSEPNKYKKLRTHDPKDRPEVSEMVACPLYYLPRLRGKTKGPFLRGEGHPDAVTAWQLGYDVYAAGSSRINGAELAEVARLVKRHGERLYMVYDVENSGSGLRGALAEAAALEALGVYDVRLVTLPDMSTVLPMLEDKHPENFTEEIKKGKVDLTVFSIACGDGAARELQGLICKAEHHLLHVVRDLEVTGGDALIEMEKKPSRGDSIVERLVKYPTGALRDKLVKDIKKTLNLDTEDKKSLNGALKAAAKATWAKAGREKVAAELQRKRESLKAGDIVRGMMYEPKKDGSGDKKKENGPGTDKIVTAVLDSIKKAGGQIYYDESQHVGIMALPESLVPTFDREDRDLKRWWIDSGFEWSLDERRAREFVSAFNMGIEVHPDTKILHSTSERAMVDGKVFYALGAGQDLVVIDPAVDGQPRFGTCRNTNNPQQVTLLNRRHRVKPLEVVDCDELDVAEVIKTLCRLTVDTFNIAEHSRLPLLASLLAGLLPGDFYRPHVLMFGRSGSGKSSAAFLLNHLWYGDWGGTHIRDAEAFWLDVSQRSVSFFDEVDKQAGELVQAMNASATNSSWTKRKHHRNSQLVTYRKDGQAFFTAVSFDDLPETTLQRSILIEFDPKYLKGDRREPEIMQATIDDNRPVMHGAIFALISQALEHEALIDTYRKRLRELDSRIHYEERKRFNDYYARAMLFYVILHQDLKGGTLEEAEEAFIKDFIQVQTDIFLREMDQNDPISLLLIDIYRGRNNSNKGLSRGEVDETDSHYLIHASLPQLRDSMHDAIDYNKRRGEEINKIRYMNSTVTLGRYLAGKRRMKEAQGYIWKPNPSRSDSVRRWYLGIPKNTNDTSRTEGEV